MLKRSREQAKREKRELKQAKKDARAEEKRNIAAGVDASVEDASVEEASVEGGLEGEPSDEAPDTPE